MQQREILEWLKQFSVNQIKLILTIKSPHGINYMQQLLAYQPEGKPPYKPVDRLDHGYAENNVNGQTSIYVRDKYRYKKKKEEKKAMEELLLENITVSRSNEWSLSVRKSFIQSGQLSECMLLFSDEMAFYQYLLIKSGSENESLWFQTKKISSFAEWLIHLFEQEIVTAYRQKQPQSLTDPLTFAETQATLPLLREAILHIITSHCETHKTAKKGKKEEDKERGSQLEISKEESSLLLKQCLQKFESERSIGEVIFEYEWAITDPQSKISRILAELSQLYIEKYKSYLIDLKMKEIEELTETPAKKKKKKPKKKVGESKEEIEKEEEVKGEIKVEEPMRRVSSNKEEAKKEKIEVKQVQVVVQQDIKVLKKEQKEQQYAKQYEIMKAKQQQQAEKAKRAIRQRINEQINFYFLKLYESSASYNKYRQMCIQLIESEVAALKIPSKWQLVLFGSFSVDFAIKKSDLDLVLIVKEQQAEKIIYRLCEHMRATKWLRNCSIVQGKIPIIEFQIILAQIEHPKLKDAKKLQQTTIHVDISVTTLQDNEGLRNTKLMKNLLEKHPSLKVIGLILKELLKISDLNKNYTGGIGSYALVMLIYSILKHKNVQFDGDYLGQLQVIASYMITEFQPYSTLVTAYPNSGLTPDPELALNIEDPQQRQLITTNAKRIGDILKIFRELMGLLEDIHHDFKGIGQQEKKKMKRCFFERWSKLFRPQQQLSEALL